ncbi:hypothetical protein FA13DRAFT_818582 [Coprinellus micaceus]|uniref:Uncharacterized protein n=1 Tax=Coprinellus micaceus TaxID=71717 RepID=A0A4Y7T2N0_COPMI|nr:hypothetical protein FA13DRAFT_818582 [Coprinellus micaceus]
MVCQSHLSLPRRSPNSSVSQKGWNSDDGGPNGSGNSSARQSWQAAPSTPRNTSGAIPTLPGLAISPNSSNEASSALLFPPSHTRPGPVPIQEVSQATQHVAGTPSRTPTPEPHQSVPAPPSPVSPPKYTIGVLRAVDAQAHLTEKTLGSIGKLLRDTRRSITTNRWAAQVGFMHDRQEFRDVFNRDALYTSHNQIIIVTVFASRSISQKAGDDVAERLSVLLGGFYGLLVWKRTVSVMRPARAHKVGKDAALFGEESGISLGGTFGSPSFESVEDSVCVKASNCAPGHPSYFHTEVRYQVRSSPPQHNVTRSDVRCIANGSRESVWTSDCGRRRSRVQGSARLRAAGGERTSHRRRSLRFQGCPAPPERSRAEPWAVQADSHGHFSRVADRVRRDCSVPKRREGHWELEHDDWERSFHVHRHYAERALCKPCFGVPQRGDQLRSSTPRA